MSNNLNPITPAETFSFSCTPQTACFNDCCRNLIQFLTPYDILRLKKHFKTRSGDFLQRYTSEHIGPESGLPVITIKPDTAFQNKCPFVTSSGCSVYKDRPSSCRMYPLIRIVSKSRETRKLREQYLLIKEAHCFGFQGKKIWTISQWLADQEISMYNEMNDLLMDIISLKNRLQPGPLDVHLKNLFHLALYDLDRFRAHLFEKELLDSPDLHPETSNLLKRDDLALLKFSFRWIRQKLFES